MSEENLDMLVTLDDPGEEDGVDAIDLLQVEDTVMNEGPNPVTFSEGDWTCSVSRLTATTDDPMIQPANQKIEIEVCDVTCSKNGAIREQKVFYNLTGMHKQIRVS